MKEKFDNLFKNSYKSKTYSPKIIIKGLTLLDGCIDFNGDIIPGKSTIVITSDNHDVLKILSAIINNKVSAFYIKEKNASSSYCGGINYTPDMINSIPFPDIKENDRIKIISYVQEILKIKNSDDFDKDIGKQEKVISIQNEIDKLVYQLYGLTDDEIKIVEENV